ncbi:MAG: hypothetical protein JXJ04_23390 [Spirochaetales bacterium]|nr:hypothetical protein [Spirochaetales bacterium]
MEVIFVNKGICGETTEQLARRLYPEIIYGIQSEYDKKPDVVIIEVVPQPQTRLANNHITVYIGVLIALVCY